MHSTSWYSGMEIIWLFPPLAVSSYTSRNGSFIIELCSILIILISEAAFAPRVAPPILLEDSSKLSKFLHILLEDTLYLLIA